jgi:hypothetical protein
VSLPIPPRSRLGRYEIGALLSGLGLARFFDASHGLVV